MDRQIYYKENGQTQIMNLCTKDRLLTVLFVWYRHIDKLDRWTYVKQKNIDKLIDRDITKKMDKEKIAVQRMDLLYFYLSGTDRQIHGMDIKNIKEY